MNEELKKTVRAVQGMEQYDESVKQVLAHKIILANILVNTVKEFKGMKPEEVEKLIEGEPYISSVPVEPGMTNKKNANQKRHEKIVGMNTEDIETAEGMVRFDILFYVRTKDGLSQIIVNIEAQKDEPSSYYIQNRAVFYACRMVSSQKERDFAGMNYNDIKKVYTIWICMNQKENSLNYLHLANEKLMGKTAIEKAGDLIHIILLGLAKNLPPYTEENKLHRLLGALFTNELTADEKISIIESEYNIEAKNELRKDVRKVSGLGESLVESAAEEAWEEAWEQSKIKFIINMNEKGYTIEQIADVTEKSREEVEAVLEKEK